MMIRLGVAFLKALLLVGALVYVCEVLGLRLLQEAGGGTTVHAAQPAGEESAVRAVVTRFHTALSQGDAAAAMATVADDAVFLEAGGVETRGEYEKNHLPADIDFEKVVPMKRSAIRVVVSGDAAWATCTTEFKGTFQGRAIDSIGTEMMVLSRGPRGWQIRAVSWSSRARPAAK
jgi:ketosteroid isomerase-like protein